MRLTLYTDYSLRVLIYLCRKKGEPVTITEMADFYKISRNHLVKIVHNLGLAGFVQTTRGKNGGVRLVKDIRKITVGDVVRKTEPDFNLLECFDRKTDTCSITKLCRLKSVLFQAKASFLNELDRHTLADIETIAELPDVPKGRRPVRPILIGKK